MMVVNRLADARYEINKSPVHRHHYFIKDFIWHRSQALAENDERALLDFVSVLYETAVALGRAPEV